MAKRGLTRGDFVSRIGQAQTRGGALFFNSAIPLSENAEVYAFGGLNYRNGESAAFRRQPAQLTQNISEIYPFVSKEPPYAEPHVRWYSRFA
ncbi:hypothetical protein, partial [Sphingobacterium sp. SGL-16]|uniref:hypothetical protein n=1 Tax=Sphingobacterium sp. SGL-16 TaxID=2710883 RepID=UPI0013EC99AA